ncbi:hypothetical protein P9239_13335 [Caballeronia sp. LZ062]|uniref:hypothetical protein n=1 Tax=unclassified Caballeronia TaxID=2646786 RepID=UPI00285A9873|nr:MULTISPECIES: hypothetical protein [unclassified Caballeronia]MDR5871326.1 hypothetical protein [Caballeronia sp. LZ062]
MRGGKRMTTHRLRSRPLVGRVGTVAQSAEALITEASAMQKEVEAGIYVLTLDTTPSPPPADAR